MTKPIGLLARISLQMRTPRLLALIPLALAACGGATGGKPAKAPAMPAGVGHDAGFAAPAAVDIAKAREKHLEQGFGWMPYEAASFAKAKAEKRFILIDGAAEWCHWCHVMDETTYRDPTIGKILSEKFVAIRVDIDARPDLAERYGEWGWPATILLSPDAEEIGKFRGYLEPEKLRAALEDVTSMTLMAKTKTDAPELRPAPVEALSWIGARSARDLDTWWDSDEGGWGRKQKAPIGVDVEFELRRALHGDASGKQRATFTLTKQRSLLDPVWGGVYQYSADSTWAAPHFEKLMTVQAASLEAYARAYQVTKDAAFLVDARAVSGYMQTFLGAPDGTFYANQDADVGAHDHAVPFVDGHVYYSKDDAGRRALGIPWVDTHVYGRENGLAISALCTLYEVSKDAAVLARARKAADAILASHVLSDGTVLHDASKKEGPFFLADAAAFARALGRLAEVSGEKVYKEKAVLVGDALVTNFVDAKSGGLWASTVDPNAAGVFGHREQPFTYVVAAARAFSTLSKITGDARWNERAKKALAAIATPKGLEDQGRWVGEFLLALDDAAVMPW